jgi:lysyl-tRNA synthetase class 2
MAVHFFKSDILILTLFLNIQTNIPMMHAISEQELVRRQKKQDLEKLGIDPYPAATFLNNASAQQVVTNYHNNPDHFQKVSLAGRMMSRRIMGAASFVELQDATGKIQLYLQRDTLCPGEDKSFYNLVFKKLLDIGDLIGVEGAVFVTQVGEVTLQVHTLTLLAKSLKPLPSVKEGDNQLYDAFVDPEQRYRQRYVDLLVTPQTRAIFHKRSRMLQVMRQYLSDQGYEEVETPILQPLYGGASAKPFKTHHHALHRTLYLRIANELYLKRLIVGGYEGVFEFAKDFRNEGMSRFHNPEFTMLELYVAYKDYRWMMDLTESLIEQVALQLHGNTQVQVGPHAINFRRPWGRFTLFEAVAHFTGRDISWMDEAALRETAADLNVALESTAGKAKIIDEIFSVCCEPKLVQPTFITDYPIEMSPLAKQHRDNPALAERFEIICNGKEICNAFSELNDPLEQRKRFEVQQALGQRGDEEAMVMDEDFLRALSYGMPPTAGLGIGIDRLAMIMTNAPSIQEVIFFPQMRPEKVE